MQAVDPEFWASDIPDPCGISPTDSKRRTIYDNSDVKINFY